MSDIFTVRLRGEIPESLNAILTVLLTCENHSAKNNVLQLKKNKNTLRDWTTYEVEFRKAIELHGQPWFEDSLLMHPFLIHDQYRIVYNRQMER